MSIADPDAVNHNGILYWLNGLMVNYISYFSIQFLSPKSPPKSPPDFSILWSRVFNMKIMN